MTEHHITDLIPGQSQNPDKNSISGRDKSILGDSALWQEFKKGNNNAFEDIYSENAQLLFGYGMRLVPNKELVMDAIQDLFVQIWDSKDRLGNVTSIKSYLCKSLRRSILSQVAKKRKTQVNYEDESFIKEYTPSVEHNLIEKQLFDQKRNELRRILSTMAQNQKEIIHLKYYGQLSYGEISEIMGLDKKAVYNLMSRTISQLRSSLGSILLSFIINLHHFPH